MASPREQGQRQAGTAAPAKEDGVGASFKDAGKRRFMFSRIEEPTIVDLLCLQIADEWARAPRRRSTARDSSRDASAGAGPNTRRIDPLSASENGSLWPRAGVAAFI